MDGKAVFFILVFLACAREAREPPAGTPFDPGSRSPRASETLEESKTDAKVSRELLELLDEYERQARESPGREFDAGATRLNVRAGSVAIECSAAGEAGELAADLESLGMTGIASFGGSVGGWLPIPAIAELEGLESLRFARAALSTTN